VLSARTVAPASVQPHPAGRGSAHMCMTQAGSVHPCAVAFLFQNGSIQRLHRSNVCICFRVQLQAERWPDHDLPTGPDEICQGTTASVSSETIMLHLLANTLRGLSTG
jgi:hypothetical protein